MYIHVGKLLLHEAPRGGKRDVEIYNYNVSTEQPYNVPSLSLQDRLTLLRMPRMTKMVE